MTIKHLLLASAAALTTANAAQAADVIMVEPEPVNFVRVCDVYGTGFYFIPGTETCIGISGYARLQVNAAGSPIRNFEDDDYEVGTQVRARVNFDVREETELGLLRAYVRLQATNNSISRGDDFAPNDVTPLRVGSNLNSSFDMDQGYIQLGGLLMGYRDSLWANDVGGIEDGLLTDTDLTAGDFNTNQASYTFAAGPFSAVLGIEDDGTGDVVPDVHGKLAVAGAWGGAFLSAVWDETVNVEDVGDFFFNPFVDSGALVGFAGLPNLPLLLEDGSNDAFALKAGAKLSDLLVAGSTLAIEGTYAFDPTTYTTVPGIGNAFSISTDVATALNPTPGAIPLFTEWTIGAGYSQAVGDFSVAVSGQYGELFNTIFISQILPGNVPVVDSASGDFYTLVGNVGYDFTSNFGALAEIQYTDVDLSQLGSVDQTRGFLRFVRSF